MMCPAEYRQRVPALRNRRHIGQDPDRDLDGGDCLSWRPLSFSNVAY
jgi:hypothetical protein